MISMRPEVEKIDYRSRNGLLFEKLIVSFLADKSRFKLLSWTGDNYVNGIYDNTNLDPDLHISQHIDSFDVDYYIECKWHHFWQKGENDYFYEMPEKPAFPEKGKAPDYLCFAYVPEMPKTNTANPGLRDYFCSVGAHWVKEFDVDGWRLDVANEVDDQFLRAFRNAVKKEKADALVIGEVWENANHYINGNMMDSAMNYDFRRFCGQFFAEKSIDASEFDARVTNLLMRYPRQATYAQLNLLDSHDVSRFLTVCREDLDKMELAVLFQMTFVGMPSIFYGDEKGLVGKSEQEYRRPMEFDVDSPLEDVYRKLIAVRKEHESLCDGEYETLLSDGKAYGYRRYDEKESVSVYLNNGEKSLSVPDEGRIIISKNYADGKLSENGYVIFVK